MHKPIVELEVNGPRQLGRSARILNSIVKQYICSRSPTLYPNFITEQVHLRLDYSSFLDSTRDHFLEVGCVINVKG